MNSWGSCRLQAPKRARVNWSSELHNRFLNAMFQLGVKNAVPKTILQVRGLRASTDTSVQSSGLSREGSVSAV